MSKKQIACSVLDLAAVTEGSTPEYSFKKSLKLAQYAENLGYTRYWLAEHHNIAGIASAATSVLIGYIAGGTKTIRVGSGGIMLPNHSSLIIAEQFGTLGCLYPGRIDLGIGRAPGTDQLTAMVIRRNSNLGAEDFPQQVIELKTYFSKENSTAKVRAIPGEDVDMPIWILGSSTDSAHLAAYFGMPYAFAGHFAPAQMQTAFGIYKNEFRPSEQASQPYIMACVNTIAADTDEEANYLATSAYQAFLGIIRNKRQLLQPPVKNMADLWNEAEKTQVLQMLAGSFIGSASTIQKNIQAFVAQTGVDELMFNAHMYDFDAKMHSYKLMSEVMRREF
ncbi:LLM class flavin-dependent oxidoreductase [Parafilimonas sp.]|uniref:LLM class flavin-dependent oxidoreductase n=1 Tax=Parafilimonas sp. TaxID=1969739 RepID=UPI0039E276CF